MKSHKTKPKWETFLETDELVFQRAGNRVRKQKKHKQKKEEVNTS